MVSEGRKNIFNSSHISFHTFISECVKKLNLLLKYAGFLSRTMGSECGGLYGPDFSDLGPARSENKNFVHGPARLEREIKIRTERGPA